MDRYYPNRQKIPNPAADCGRKMRYARTACLDAREMMTRSGLNWHLSSSDDILKKIKVMTEGTIG